jgi:hypothetical protein
MRQWGALVGEYKAVSTVGAAHSAGARCLGEAEQWDFCAGGRGLGLRPWL